DLSQYISNLTIHLLNIYRTDPKKVDLKIEIGDVYLDINTAIPCGLIINELVSNSLKYAFPGKRRGTILIKLDIDKRGKYVLNISDNGVGLPEDLNIENTDTLGFQLVNDLTKQIQGKLTMTRKPGTAFKIVF
ncbi:MAG: sensor histidine kinase, partial [Candidatus Aminicenantes bacterium]|nr:sensor histidine kinase [Candidatus Aminicenantes bacterium]